jgi:hypothetical protein
MIDFVRWFIACLARILIILFIIVDAERVASGSIIPRDFGLYVYTQVLGM